MPARLPASQLDCLAGRLGPCSVEHGRTRLSLPNSQRSIEMLRGTQDCVSHVNCGRLSADANADADGWHEKPSFCCLFYIRGCHFPCFSIGRFWFSSISCFNSMSGLGIDRGYSNHLITLAYNQQSGSLLAGWLAGWRV